MSTGLECQFVKVASTEQWFYLLERWNAPRCAWDWREFADAYGPFDSYGEACEHLRDNHANPGGHSIDERADPQTDPVLARLIQEATCPEPEFPVSRPRYF